MLKKSKYVLIIICIFLLYFACSQVGMSASQSMFFSVATGIYILMGSMAMHWIFKNFEQPKWELLYTHWWWKIPCACLAYYFWFAVAGTYTDFLLLTYFLFTFFTLFESRISIFIALALLAYGPIILYLKMPLLIDIIALYAFYFLVIGILTQIRAKVSWYNPRKIIS